MLDHLAVAFDEEYITDDVLKQVKEDSMLILRKLNGYIQYLEKRKTQQ
jgi:hypothetical protein